MAPHWNIANVFYLISHEYQEKYLPFTNLKCVKCAISPFQHLVQDFTLCHCLHKRGHLKQKAAFKNWTINKMDISLNSKLKNTTRSHGRWTKLQIFRLNQYNTLNINNDYFYLQLPYFNRTINFHIEDKISVIHYSHYTTLLYNNQYRK